MSEYQGPNQHPKLTLLQRIRFWWMSRKDGLR
ncbi:Uncharacterised protein [Mycobacteroides abscessus subsp. abscessus]|nr:Uncharacterised protein [Mycobacteroides abscessus subsp. abscessus]SHW69798.1 Uncharacterised protein [Mycobacteroides abscessus subsp. abscessus]SIF02105.1 Uncharacterised protein [Mycobacteroides abscessus subsp. abscessus]SKU20468.1 Uncharacterised protein [Mycobacteroides abscessus subsp. abscessus]SKW00332.1 Uncharacterised protein [Mycobacteroides abscessus subsp. abscessus]